MTVDGNCRRGTRPAFLEKEGAEMGDAADDEQQAARLAERRKRSHDAAQPGQTTVDKLLENCE